MTELQFYKSKARTIKVPAYYIVEDGKIILDRDEILNEVENEISRVEGLASKVQV